MQRASLPAATLALLFSTYCLAGPAQPRSISNLAGVWKGTIGKSAVVACFQSDEELRGQYYYVRMGKAIELRASNGESELSEQPVDEESSTGTWKFEKVTGDTIGGNWTNGSKATTLPLKLIRVALLGEEEAASCQSTAYGHAYYHFVQKSLVRAVTRAGLHFRLVQLTNRQPVRLLEFAGTQETSKNLGVALERMAQRGVFGLDPHPGRRNGTANRYESLD